MERQYTQSKLGCWMGLDRAIRLAGLGAIDAADVPRWRRENDSIRKFVLTSCWSKERRSLVAYADTQALDASVLLAGREGFFGVDRQRFATTVDAVRRELRAGRFLYRTSDSPGQEGAFLACSFWLVDALARIGHLEEAAEVMEVACGAGNELGLLSEEVDPETGDLLGNFPQALSHLALANAAGTLQAATS